MCVDDYREGHILIGVIMTLAAIVLMALATFTSPFRHDVYFLSLSNGLQFGAFGYCQSAQPQGGEGCTVVYGYVYQVEGKAMTILWLTKAALCFPMALLWSLCTSACCATHHLWFRTWKFIGCALAILAEVFALLLWITARNKFHSIGLGAQLGPAIWIGLGGAVAALLGLMFGGPKYNGRFMYRAHPDYPYHL